MCYVRVYNLLMLNKSQQKDVIKNRVLVVDDDEPIRLMYVMKLQKSGFVVESARDGDEGLKKAEEFKPHLILLDIKMPHMGGDEMLHHLRETDWGNKIRVIVLTNLGKEEVTMGLFLLDIKRYIIKANTTPSQIAEIAKEVLSY
jgi:DNA-binding response OmpR family regulator